MRMNDLWDTEQLGDHADACGCDRSLVGKAWISSRADAVRCEAGSLLFSDDPGRRGARVFVSLAGGKDPVVSLTVPVKSVQASPDKIGDERYGRMAGEWQVAPEIRGCTAPDG